MSKKERWSRIAQLSIAGLVIALFMFMLVSQWSAIIYWGSLVLGGTSLLGILVSGFIRMLEQEPTPSIKAGD